MAKPNVTIIGSGVVGRATGLAFEEKGLKVKYFDVIDKGLWCTMNLKQALADSDVSFVCVPTPTKNGVPITSFVFDAVASIRKYARKGHLVVIKSTVLPGTNNELFKKYSNYLSLASNPEFLREDHAFVDACNPEKIVCGVRGPKDTDLLERVYMGFSCEKFFVDIKTAELIKYANNFLLAARVSLFNELRMVCEQERLDIDLVTDIVCLDQRIGHVYNKSGFAWGKPCFPKDTQSLLYKYPYLEMLKATIAVNKKYYDAGRYHKTDQKYFSEVWGWAQGGDSCKQ